MGSGSEFLLARAYVGHEQVNQETDATAAQPRCAGRTIAEFFGADAGPPCASLEKCSEELEERAMVKFEVGFYTVQLADDDSARVSFTASGKLVFEGPAYEVARKLEEQAKSFEAAKQFSQRSAEKIRQHTRAATHPWELWVASQWFTGTETKQGKFARHASYKTRAAAERAADKLAKKPRLNDYGEPQSGPPDLYEVRKAVPGKTHEWW